MPLLVKQLCRSRFVEDLALEKLHEVCGRFLAFRAKEKARLCDKCLLGDVTTVNLTQLEGGAGQPNVIPGSGKGEQCRTPVASSLLTQKAATFDIRVATGLSLK